MTAKTEKAVKRIMIIVLLALFASIIAMPYVVHRTLPESPLIKMHQQMHHSSLSIGAADANAQVEEGYLLVWLLENAPDLEQILVYIGVAGVLDSLVKTILPFLQGRPEGNSTWCVTSLLGLSNNRLIKELVTSFSALLRKGITLSHQWWNYTDRAKALCADMANKCGAALGNEACQKYLNNAIEWNTPCALASYWAQTFQKSYDIKYAACQ